jgi:uncharacterized small protein (DUF1192 family)
MDGVWTTYNEAAARLGVTPEAVRRRAIRNNWARMPGNDGKTRVMVPNEVHSPSTPHVTPDTSALVSSLEAHIATLKTEIERLTAELAGERVGRQGEVELLKGQLVTERERGDRWIAELTGERAGRQADQEQHQEQLTAARAAADKATAELVEFARRLAAIAETQTAEAEPEPPRHWAIRAWRWMQKSA